VLTVPEAVTCTVTGACDPLLPMATVPRLVCAAALGAQASRRVKTDRQQNNAFSTHHSFFPDAEH
jgi:hypothetical protein